MAAGCITPFADGNAMPTTGDPHAAEGEGKGEGEGGGEGGGGGGAGAIGTALIDCYFKDANGRQLIAHQLDSFNDFIKRILDHIIQGFNSLDVCNKFNVEHGCHQYVVTLVVSKATLGKPTIHEKDGTIKVMNPNDARLRNMTYAAPLTVDIQMTAKTLVGRGAAPGEPPVYVTDTKRFQSVGLGRIPIMVRSNYCQLELALAPMRVQYAKVADADDVDGGGGGGGGGGSGSGARIAPQSTDECVHDRGGYFVINGSEKVVISQDRIAENRTYVFLNTKATCFSHVAEIRSVQEARFGVPKTLTLKLASKANHFGRPIKLVLHHIKHDVPLFIVFRALGVETDRDIVRFVVLDPDDPAAGQLADALVGSMDDGSSIRSTRLAQEYLAQHLAVPHHQQHVNLSAEHRAATLRNVLRKDFLPHVGPELLCKALYLGHMVRRLLRCQLGLCPVDDRDSYINKRLDTPGVLLANLFRQYYGKVVKDMRALVQKDINSGAWRPTNKLINVITTSNIYKLFKPTTIEAGLKYGLATGNWGIKTSRPRQGVAQVRTFFSNPGVAPCGRTPRVGQKVDQNEAILRV
jgi:DNA-directed RNA polymerase II subunit RPB2